MLTRKLLLVASLLATACAVGCSSQSSEEDEPTSEDELSTKNLGSGDFGLQDKEIVLTIDDGPGPRTSELVDFFVREKVPAVFFQVGKNARANPATLQKIADASRQIPGGLIIANHSMTHTTPLPQQGTTGAKAEILNADAILKNAIVQSQSQFGNAKSFFRPPYGAFTALGATKIGELNQTEAGKYVGPIFWNIGGELSANYSADWACWGRNGVNIRRCADGYLAEARARGRGLMLVHDVHSKTIDMLTGSGEANGRSLIKEMRAAGFKFVGLRAHDSSVQRFANDQRQIEASTNVQLVSKVEIVEVDGKHAVQVSVEQQGAAKIQVLFDQNTQGQTFTDGRFVTKSDLAPGQHFVTVVALDRSGRVLKAEKSNIIVPADIEQGSYDGDARGCVNFDLMKAGQRYRMFHKKVACGTEGAWPVAGVDGECYKYKATLTASRDPKLVGPGEWSAQFDVGYKTDPNDKSKLTIVMDAESGEVSSAVRHDWKINGRARDNVGVTLSSVECEKGIWRGEMKYANGASEEVMFRMVRDPMTGGKIDVDDGEP